MSSYSLAPTFGVGYQAFTVSGIPLTSGQIFTYAATTTTPIATYSNGTGTPNANPIVLGADGRPAGEIWLLDGQSYRFDLKDSFNNTIRSFDNISSVGTISTNLAASSGSSLVGFIQTGTGAVATTAQAKMRYIVDARDFGVVADGTTDNATFLNNAFAIAGAMVQLPTGTMLIKSNLNTPVCAGIVGNGIFSSIIKLDTGVTKGLDIGNGVLQGGYYADFSVYGDGNGGATANGTANAIGISVGVSTAGSGAGLKEISYAVFERVGVRYCQGTGAIGWKICDANFGAWNQCVTQLNTRNAVLTPTGFAGTTPADVKFDLCTFGSPVTGQVNVTIFGGGNITFEQPQFLGMKESAVYIESDTYSCPNIKIVNPHIEAVDGAGLYAFRVFSSGATVANRACLHLKDCVYSEGVSNLNGAKMLIASGVNTWVYLENFSNSGGFADAQTLRFDGTARGVIEGWGTIGGGPFNSAGYTGNAGIGSLLTTATNGVVIGTNTPHTAALAASGVMVCGTSGTITLDAAASFSNWKRTGDKVEVDLVFTVASVSSPTGTLTLTNVLPFAVTSTASVPTNFPVTVFVTLLSSAVNLQGYCPQGTKNILIQETNGAAAAGVFQGTSFMVVHAEYVTDQASF